jgi:hypothetical protein
VTGTLSSTVLERSYVIGAREGQTLLIDAKAKSNMGLDFVNFIVKDPSGRPAGGDQGQRASLRLRQTGDYVIAVSPPGAFYRGNPGKKLTFTLFIGIE